MCPLEKNENAMGGNARCKRVGLVSHISREGAFALNVCGSLALQGTHKSNAGNEMFIFFVLKWQETLFVVEK